MIVIIVSLLCAYILLFLLSIYLKDNTIADIFWGSGFILIAWISYFLSDMHQVQLFLTLLITVWWARLTIHIWSKKLSHAWEDARYARWRESWKYFYLRSFFQVYILQGFLMILIAFPLYAHLFFEIKTYTIWVLILWVLLAMFWLIYEIIADTELKQFMKTKKSWEILTWGLRKYHRYPQYFWESIFWLGISITAVFYSPLVFAGWIIITFLLLQVSWVPLLEFRYRNHDAYQKYAQYTPIFFPHYLRICKYIKNHTK